MAEQKKRGFHAFEDRVHQIEEEDRQREAQGQERTNEAGAERGGAPAREAPEKPKK